MPISVVLPAYNEEDGIVECLERLIQQGDAIAEIIVVNNNSTDATARLVTEVAERDSRVRLVDELRAGVSYARYTGFDAATQDVIASIDSDTVVLDGWAAAVERTFAEYPQIEAGGAPMIMHDLPLQKGFARRQSKMKQAAAERLAAGRTTPMSAMSGANSVVRRRSWEKIKDQVSYRRDVFEDLDRSLHLQSAGITIALIPGMSATVSGRRLLSSPAEFVRYIACAARTYRLHGKNGMAAVAWVVGIRDLIRTTVLLPVNRSWNPDDRTFSIRQLRSDNIVRESPIKSGLD